MKNNLQPEIRFHGYEGNWEKYKLGEHSRILTGGTPKTKIEEYWNPKDIPWMSSGEINKKRLVDTDNYISNLGFDNSSARWVKENSILIALAGQGKTRGTVAINEIPLTTNQSIAAIEINNILNTEFVFQNLQMRYDELRLMSSGDGTRGGLNKKIISEIEIYSPKEEEQQKIGEFFKQLDNRITLQQRHVEQLKQSKRGFLQKMFPKDGESVPEVRFDGFSGEWYEKQFISIIDRVSEKSADNDLPRVEFEDIVSGEGRLNNNIYPKIDNRKGILFKPEYILYGKLRPYLKNWLLADFKGIALGDFWVFKTKNVASFVYTLIQTGKFQAVANLSTGTKMPRSDWNTVSKTIFMIPSIKEQQKIGEFFKQLDDLIAKNERELELLKETKKGFLQKMFV